MGCRRFLLGLAWLVLAGSAGAQTPTLLPPPPASVCVAPTVPTEPGNVHMFPGRWWNPQRNGIGWDFFYGEGQQSMYLTWFTYDASGRPIWLHGENKPLQFNAVTGERTWQSSLYVAKWTFSTRGMEKTRVGAVSMTFPNQTTTRAAVRWRWDGSSAITPVGNVTHDECLYDTFRDQRALQPGRGTINQAFSSNWFYRGVPGDALVGWGVDLLVDIDPANGQYVETASAAIFDTSGRPAWLQSVDPWPSGPPADDTLTDANRGKLRYIRYTVVNGEHPAATQCPHPSAATCGPDDDHGPPGPDYYGRFGRRIDDAANGFMHLVADVPTAVTGGALIDWPPPNNQPSLGDQVPVMRFDANHIIVDKSVCRVPNDATPCTFQVSWSTNDATAKIRRIDLNNNQQVTPIATGLSAIHPDQLPLGARVQYEISYRYNGTGVLTTLRTPEVRVMLQDAIADANVQNIACKPSGDNGCDLEPHDRTTGTIAGEASTDGGSARYSMPITVPPGRNGVEPKLALNYSSRGSNGIAGLGWSLSGHSAIHRCPRTQAQDAGQAAAIGLGANDALCLDGERLVVTAVNGVPAPTLSYGVDRAYYRTEINNFARVQQFGSLTGAASCFKVEHKDGEVSYYGGVPGTNGACSGGNSRQVPYPLSVPLSWNIERHEDASGNSIHYHYGVSGQPNGGPEQHGFGEKLLLLISYTGTGEAEGDRRVHFQYDLRPVSDRSRSYLAGGLTERTRRLTRISTSVGGISVNSYTLNYVDPISEADASLHSGRSALQSIRQCATGGDDNDHDGDGNEDSGIDEVCLPETVVAWNDLPPDYVLRPLAISGIPAPATDGEGNFVDRHVQTIGDLDGDGVRELIVRQLEADQQRRTWLIKQNADRTTTSTLDVTSIGGSMSYFVQGMQTDYDGDGRSELVAADDGSYLRAYRWNLPRGANFGATPATTFTTSVLSGVSPGQQLVASDDIDGDGRPDLLLRRRGTGCSGTQNEVTPGPNSALHAQVICYYRNTTESPTAISFAPGEKVYGWEHESVEGGVVVPGDLNGDGTSDIVLMTKVALANARTIETISSVLLSQSPGVAPPQGCTDTLSAQWDRCESAALNLPTTNSGYRSLDAVMRWHDVNGDGLSDLLYALPGSCTSAGRICQRGSWHVQIANGRGFNAAVAIGGNTDALLMTGGKELNHLRYAGQLPSGDVDSDGKLDLLYPVALAARQCSAVKLTHKIPDGEDTCGEYDAGPETLGGDRGKMQTCERTVWLCSDDPAAAIAGTSGYALPNPTQMPAPVNLPTPASISDNLYQLRTVRASFTAFDQSLYYMGGLRFVPVVRNGVQTYDAQSFSLDASAGPDRAAHRLAMTLDQGTAINGIEDLYGDGLQDLTLRAGCYNQGLSATNCRFVGHDASVGPTQLPVGVSPNAAPVMLNVNDLNNGLRAFVNENVGVAEGVNGAAPTLPGLVRSVTNGYGDTTAWTYYPLSSRAGRAAGQLPLHVLPSQSYVDKSHFYFQSTMPVVGSMAASTGTGSLLGFRSWRYGYSEAMYNRLGRGFQGFRAIVREQTPQTTEASRAVRELTLFHQKFPLTGKIERTRSGAPLPSITTQPLLDWVRPFSEVSYVWGCRTEDRLVCPTDGAPEVGSFDYPFLNLQTTTSYDAASAETGVSTKFAETIEYHFDPAQSAAAGWDDYGNALHTEIYARDLAEAPGHIAFVTEHRTRSTATYATTTTPQTWWPGKLLTTTETLLPVVYAPAHRAPADLISGDFALSAQTLTTSYDWNADRTPRSVIVEPTDPLRGSTKTFGYPAAADNHGLPSSVSDTFHDSVAGGTVTRTTSTVYDTDGYFPMETTDAAGATTTTEFRARDGQVATTTSPVTTTSPEPTRTRTRYDAFGRSFRSTTFGVDKYGVETLLAQPVHTAWNRCSDGLCSGVGNGGVRIGSVFSAAEQHAAYRVTTVQNGSPTRVVWHDLLGREIKNAARGFDGTFVAQLSEYDRMGALSRQSVPFPLTGLRTAAPFASTMLYDRAGRLTSKTAPDAENAIGQAPPLSRHLTTTYAYTGNRMNMQVRNSRNLCMPSNLCVDVARYSGVLGLMRADDALGGVTRYWADAAKRPVAIADAKVNAQHFSPEQSIPAGKVTRARYDKFGHRIDTADPNQGRWSFVYNGAGDLVQQTDARGRLTTFHLDSAGRPTAQTSELPAFEGSPVEHTRDEWTYRSGDGLLTDVKRCVADAKPTRCTLDGEQPNVRGNTVWRESYVYRHGRPTVINAMQRVGLYQKEYATLLHYDGNHGREKAVEYQSGLRVQRIFTKYGALRDVIDADTGERYWGIGAADAFGNATRQDYGNGVVGDYTYDPLSGRSLRKQWSRFVNGQPQVLDRVDYGYDVVTNVTAQRRIVPNVVDTTETYTYDALQRLRQSVASGSGYSVGYDYDALGNLTRKSDHSRDVANAYVYDSANGCGPNVATTVLMRPTAGYDRAISSCDANGNVIKTQPVNVSGQLHGDSRRIRYDTTNRPRFITDASAPGSPTAHFTYAPDGRRVHEILNERYYPNPTDTGATRTRHVVQGTRGYQVELVNDADGWDGAIYRHEIGDVSVVLREVGSSGGRTREVAYKMLDRLGSPLGVMDKNGQLQISGNDSPGTIDTRLSFSPFGGARQSDFQPRESVGRMPGRVDLTPATRLGFTGHEHLDSLGLIHMNGRVYDHRLGRFLSVDPLIQFPANSQSHNPYSYILNNPMGGTDPSGYSCWDNNNVCAPLEPARQAYTDNAGFAFGGIGVIGGGPEGNGSIKDPLVATRTELLRSELKRFQISGRFGMSLGASPSAIDPDDRPVTQLETVKVTPAIRVAAGGNRTRAGGAARVESYREMLVRVEYQSLVSQIRRLDPNFKEPATHHGPNSSRYTQQTNASLRERLNGLREATGFLNRTDAFNAARRDAGIPLTQRPESVQNVKMTARDGSPMLRPDGSPVMTLEYVYRRGDGSRIVIQNHSYGHRYEDGAGTQGPHFNVRPIENTRTGSVPGTLPHYPWKP